MKYIIEIKDDVQMVQKVGVAKNGNAFVMNFYKDQLEELTADYINEHYSNLQDDAYERGHGVGYQKGFEDGKAVNGKECEGCKYTEMGSDTTICAQCCNAYYNQWTAKQTDDEIKVGDEVKPFYTDITGVVTLIDGDTIYALWRDGSSTSTMKLKEVTKTGRHFDIASILKEMQS